MAVLTCVLCTASVDTDSEPGAASAALTWTLERDHGVEVRYCPSCARDHVRSIEAGLTREFFQTA